jgi:hypothetical protein
MTARHRAAHHRRAAAGTLVGDRDVGGVSVSSTGNRSFTIRNTNADLTGLGITIDGADASTSR